MLRKIRIAAAAFFFVLTTLLFLDFTGTLHAWFGWMAKIQFLPALLALNVGVVAFLVILTLLFGRVYCSVICPLGVMQDIVSWASGKRRKHRNRFAYSPALTWLRRGMLVVFVAAMLAGVGSLLAPYSAYGRIASNLLAPVYAWCNNLLAYIAGRMDSYAFYSVDVWMKSLSTLLVAVVTFAVLFVLAWRSGRTYCNTICPVGTVLGFLARYSLFKPRFDTSKCNGCKLCARNCKASCIDPAAHKIDYSRCVACMDCLENCRQGAITYTLRRRKPDPAPAPQRPAADAAKTPSDASRRRFLGLAGIVAQTRQDRTSTVIPGVAIATALIPPLCTAGFGLATGQFKFFIGAFYLFFINTVFIALATYMVVRMLKYHKKKFLDPARERYVKRIMLLITLLTFIPSVVIGLHMVRVSFFESAVDRYVQQEFQFEHTRVIECKKAYKHGDRNSRIELLLIGEPLGEEIIGNARAQLYNYGLQDVELIVRQARTGDRVDLKSLQLSYSELLDEKNAQIDELKQRLSKYKMKNIEYDDISREAGAVVPDIQSISLSKCLSYDVGGTVQDTLLICVVKSRQPMTEADAERLRRWLEVRTKIAQVKLYTE